MIQRFHISNGEVFVETPATPEGRAWIEKYRSEYAAFKGRHIKEVLQAYPSKVNLFTLTEHS